jgi:tRNA (adenine37-N6)-methyltransferase
MALKNDKRPKKQSQKKVDKEISNINFLIHPIGIAHSNDEKGEYSVEIYPKYLPALKELEKYSHLNIIWWGTKTDTPKHREILQVSKLPPFYGDKAPTMGIFATRSEYRPNPILITSVQIIKIDQKSGQIIVPYLDAFEGTPIIDLKPYLPMTDRIMRADYPPYLQHWPKNNEDAAEWWAKQIPPN